MYLKTPLLSIKTRFKVSIIMIIELFTSKTTFSPVVVFLLDLAIVIYILLFSALVGILTLVVCRRRDI